MCDAILFDNDGTIVDTRELILDSFHHSMEAVLGYTLPDEDVIARVGIPLADQVREFTSNEEDAMRMLRIYREHNHEHHDARVKAFPGIVDALEELHGAGIPLGVVTSKMHALAWRGLEIVGAAPYLTCCIGADDCPVHKPKPEPILAGIRALEELGGGAPLDLARCAYVGDSIFDIQAGNAAGCKTIAVTWGMGPRADLEAANPTHIVDTMEELLSICM
ncbi:MAG: HAD family hydrolase [Coriobacteriales bacterium]|jgi:pyrophosphatase PpaX